jgi:hypothetical protein
VKALPPHSPGLTGIRRRGCRSALPRDRHRLHAADLDGAGQRTARAAVGVLAGERTLGNDVRHDPWQPGGARSAGVPRVDGAGLWSPDPLHDGLTYLKKDSQLLQGSDLLPTRKPHNQYLLTTAEVGLVGLARLLLFAQQWRYAAGLQDELSTTLARGLMLTIMVGSLFNSLLIDHVESLLFAWLSGLLFAALPPTAAASWNSVFARLRP